MKRRTFALALAAVIALAMAVPASAQWGQGQNPWCPYDRIDAAAHDFQADGYGPGYGPMNGPRGMGPGPLWDSESIATIKGEVEKVGNREFPRFGRARIAGMVVTTEEGPVPVVMGPQRFLRKHKFLVEPKDQVSVTGSMVEIGGRKVMLAQTIENHDKTLKLRHKNGKPYWKRPRAARNFQNQPMMWGRGGRGNFQGPPMMGRGGMGPCGGPCTMQGPGQMWGRGGQGQFRGQCDMQGPGRYQGRQFQRGYGNPDRPMYRDGRRHMRRDVFNDD